MKVAQNDETISDTQPVRPPHPPNLSNLQLSPSGSSARKHGTPGILPGCFPLHRYHLLPRRTRLALPVILLCTCLLCIYCFSPLFSSVDPVTMVKPLWSTTSSMTPPCGLSNQASPPPLITRYRLLSSILLALE